MTTLAWDDPEICGEWSEKNQWPPGETDVRIRIQNHQVWGKFHV
jgi:hypothetical protein